jgi:hypothetical protein
MSEITEAYPRPATINTDDSAPTAFAMTGIAPMP